MESGLIHIQAGERPQCDLLSLQIDAELNDPATRTHFALIEIFEGILNGR